ncbi:MAG: biopolymer transporter ExbD [Planctomycetota bacterium]
MTPMIDVVFLLLVFFVWTSSFETPEYDLPGAIAETPAGGSIENTDTPPPVESFDEVVLKLQLREGLPVIEMSSIRTDSMDEVRRRISEIVALGVQPPVVIDPEPEIKMDFAVAVFDAVREAGADRVLYAIE